MHSATTDAAGSMRISQLAQAAGVSRETIHFYLREGLLPSPRKVNARLSLFDEGHLARLRVIKAFQQAHIPLARIREQLDAMSSSGTPETPALLERTVAVVSEFLSLDGEEPAMSIEEVADRVGLSPEQLSRLEELGVLEPQTVDGQAIYTRAEVEAAEAARTILEQGVPVEKLRFVRRYSELAGQEMAFLRHHVIEPALAAGRREQVSATAANRGLRVLEAYLRRQYRRRTLLFSPEIENPPDPLAREGDASPMP